MTDKITLALERRAADDVAAKAAVALSHETQQDLAAWAIRAGLGPLFLQHHAGSGEYTNEEVGRLMSVTFDAEHDPVHHDVATKIREWCEDGE